MEDKFAALPQLLTVADAAEAVAMSAATIRAAIRAGELRAMIPRGRDPMKAGPGQGYRIDRVDLYQWFTGGKS